MVFYSLISLAVFFIDQLIKQKVSLLFSPGEGFPVIRNIFHITLVFNKGIAFGLFQNIPLFFLISAVIVFLFSLFRYNRPFTGEKKLAVSLISAGILSNLLDRMRLGYVVDYLDFRIWPVFNIGDASLTIGMGLLVWGVLRQKTKHKDANRT